MPKASTRTPGQRGRRPDASSTSGKIRELLTTGMSVGEIAKKLGCKPALVYNVKARANKTKGGSTAAGGVAKRGPGRPPKAKPATQGVDALGGILAAVQNSERERSQMRAALERIQAILRDALA